MSKDVKKPLETYPVYMEFRQQRDAYDKRGRWSPIVYYLPTASTHMAVWIIHYLIRHRHWPPCPTLEQTPGCIRHVRMLKACALERMPGITREGGQPIDKLEGEQALLSKILDTVGYGETFERELKRIRETYSKPLFD